jgi:hypothetical protein
MTNTTNAGPEPTADEMPILPEHPLRVNGGGWTAREIRLIEAYGRQCWNACDEQVAGPLRDQLAECFCLSGADPDGNENWRLAPSAVDAVRQLRADYDEACDEAERLRERVAELERELQETKAAAKKWVESEDLELFNTRAELDRLRAECEALRADAERYRWLEKPGNASVYIHTGPHLSTTYACKERMRAAIDAARAAREGN